MAQKKVFAGTQVRALRADNGLTQKQLADRLDISTSYVNQIENNQRPLTAGLMLTLADEFKVDLTGLLSDKSDRLLADLREVFADPLFAEQMPGLIEMKNVTVSSPDTAHALLRLYEAYRKANDRLASVDAAMADAPQIQMQTSYEEVRDFFHYAGNYFDGLDRAAEALAQELGLTNADRMAKLVAYFADTHQIDLRIVDPARPDMIRDYDRTARILRLSNRLPEPSQFFQAAAQLALLEQTTAINSLIEKASFNSAESAEIARMGLANYFAGALHLPYAAFLSTAEEVFYDIDELGFRFGASREQVGHRLSTMQRPGAKGVPFFFARVDAAGTITKRHSATPLQFARFGGACPLWNVHRAFEAHGHIIRQLAETPDANRYLCLAWSSETRIGAFHGPERRYAYALGCEVAHAPKLTYASDLDLRRDQNYDPIGISCRLCERRVCPQRAVPPVAGTIHVDASRRTITPFEVG